ncbi:MAG: hypothetical protein ACTSSP_05695 [Candidatus Asgardarchaeia archaeon]
MLNKKKKKALLVVVVAGVICLVTTLLFGFLLFLFFPLLIALIVVVLGMFCKWGIEWFVKNIHLFGLGEKVTKVKKKLKIDEGVTLVKDSIRTLREKEEQNKK